MGKKDELSLGVNKDLAKEFTNFVSRKKYIKEPQTLLPGQVKGLTGGVDYSRLEKELGAGTSVFDKTLQQRLGEEQSAWNKWGNFAMQVGAEIIGGTIEGIGYLGDVQGTAHLLDKDMTSFGNWVADIGVAMKEGSRERFPIFGAHDMGNLGFWLSNGVSVASTLSLMIPATGAVRGIGMLGKAVGLAGKLGKETKAVMGVFGQAFASRHMENFMEASQTWDATKQIMFNSKKEDGSAFSLQEVNAAAAEAASNLYKVNWALLAQDVFQYALLGRGPKASMEITNRRLAKAAGQGLSETMRRTAFPYLKDAISEGAEEAAQFIFSEETRYRALLNAGAIKEKDASERFKGYMKDSELWTSALFGAIGSGVMQGAGAGLRRTNIPIFGGKKQQEFLEERIAHAKEAYASMSEAAMDLNAAVLNKDEEGIRKAEEKIRFNLAYNAAALGNFDITEATIDAFVEEVGKSEQKDEYAPDLAQRMQLLKKDMRTVAKLYEKNAKKYAPSSVRDITQLQFDNLQSSNKLKEVSQNLDAAKREFPRHDKLSTEGQELFDLMVEKEALNEALVGSMVAQAIKLDKTETEEEQQAIANQTTNFIKEVETQIKQVDTRIKEIEQKQSDAISNENKGALVDNARNIAKRDIGILDGFVENSEKVIAERLKEIALNTTIDRNNEILKLLTSKKVQNLAEEKQKQARQNVTNKTKEAAQQVKDKKKEGGEQSVEKSKEKVIKKEEEKEKKKKQEKKKEPFAERIKKLSTEKLQEIQNTASMRGDTAGVEAIQKELDSRKKKDEPVDSEEDNLDEKVVEKSNLEATNNDEQPPTPDNPISTRQEEVYPFDPVSDTGYSLAWLSVTKLSDVFLAEQEDPELAKLITDYLENPEINLVGTHSVRFKINEKRLESYKSYKPGSTESNVYKAWVKYNKDPKKNPLGNVMLGQIPMVAELLDVEGNIVTLEDSNGNERQLVIPIHDATFENWEKLAEVEVSEGYSKKDRAIDELTDIKRNILNNQDSENVAEITEQRGGVPYNVEEFTGFLDALNLSSESAVLLSGSKAVNEEGKGDYLTSDKSVFDPFIEQGMASNATPGAFYAVVKRPNGEFFPVRLWTSKIEQAEAELIYNIYKKISEAKSKEESLYDVAVTDSRLEDIFNEIKESDDPKVSGLQDIIKEDRNMTLSDLLSLLVYEGNVTKGAGKYQLRLTKKELKIGNTSYSVKNLEGKRDQIIEALKSRVRQVSLKKANSQAYKTYLSQSEILTANFKPGKNNFVQGTVVFGEVNNSKPSKRPSKKKKPVTKPKPDTTTEETLEEALGKRRTVSIAGIPTRVKSDPDHNMSSMSEEKIEKLTQKALTKFSNQVEEFLEKGTVNGKKIKGIETVTDLVKLLFNRSNPLQLWPTNALDFVKDFLEAKAAGTETRTVEEFVTESDETIRSRFKPTTDTTASLGKDVLRAEPNSEIITKVGNNTIGNLSKAEQGQDAIAINEEKGIYAITDGMGGENMARVVESSVIASAIADKLAKGESIENISFEDLLEHAPNEGSKAMIELMAAIYNSKQTEEYTYDEALEKLEPVLKNFKSYVIKNAVRNYVAEVYNKGNANSGILATTTVMAKKKGKNTYTITKTGDTVYAVINEDGSIDTSHGLSSVAITSGVVFGLNKAGKTETLIPDIDTFKVSLKPGQRLLISTDFIETQEALNDFIKALDSGNLNLKEFTKSHKIDDATFAMIEHSETKPATDTTTKVKEGISEVFNENPELAEIGTEEQYSEYLKTIFPNSVVDSILYHGSKFAFDVFKNISELGLSNTKSKTAALGNFFTDSRELAELYTHYSGKEHKFVLNDRTRQEVLNLARKLDPLFGDPKAEKVWRDFGDSLEERTTYKDLNKAFIELAENPEKIDSILKRRISGIGKTTYFDAMASLALSEPALKELFGPLMSTAAETIAAQKELILLQWKEAHERSPELGIDKMDPGEWYESQGSGLFNPWKASPNVKAAIINLENPTINDDSDFNQEKDSRSFLQRLTEGDTKNSDGYIFENVLDPLRSNIHVTKDASQIHVLGSKKDIKGFKEFVGKPTTDIATAATTDITEPTVTTEEVIPGVEIKRNALSKEEQLELFNALKLYIEEQGTKSNKGKAANIMTGLGLRWDYKSNNPNQKPIKINGIIVPGSAAKYGYYDKSSEETGSKPLGEISPRIKELMTKATGIDATNYDGAIINLYTEDTFISAHNDVDEAADAIDYPVLVANIGGSGNFSVERPTKMTELEAGDAYVFGINGKNRKVFHRTFPAKTDGFLPALTTKVDGRTYPAGSYRISITLRRVKNLEEGMPKSPASTGPAKSTTTTTEETPILEVGRYVKTKDGNTYIIVAQTTGGKWKVYDPVNNTTKTILPKDLTVSRFKGTIVEQGGSKYIVTSKGDIISLHTKKKLKYKPTHPTAKAIRKKAAEIRAKEKGVELIDVPVSEAVEEQVAEVKANIKKFKIKGKDGVIREIGQDDDFESYVLVDSKGNILHELARVSTFVTPEGVDKTKPLVRESLIIGTKADGVVRDFFEGELKDYAEYELTTEEEFNNFIEQLQDLKERFEKDGETVLASGILAYNVEMGAAGTLDLLTYDVDGNFRIYDIKTQRAKDGKGKNERINRYTGKTDYDSEFTDRDTGEVSKSDRQKHQEQLSMYKMMLEKTHGIKVEKVEIIPVLVDYNRGDEGTETLKLLENIPHNPLNELFGFSASSTNNSGKKASKQKKGKKTVNSNKDKSEEELKAELAARLAGKENFESTSTLTREQKIEALKKQFKPKKVTNPNKKPNKSKLNQTDNNEFPLPGAEKIIGVDDTRGPVTKEEINKVISILPSDVRFEMVEDYIDVLSGGRATVGAFKSGLITLSIKAKSGDAYHEAFHAVFRSALSKRRRTELLEEAKEIFLAPLESDISFLQDRHALSREDAIDLYYEEQLADEFGVYSRDPSNYVSKEGKSKNRNLFKRLLEWIKNVIYKPQNYKTLFGDVLDGKFRAANNVDAFIQNNTINSIDNITKKPCY